MTDDHRITRRPSPHEVNSPSIIEPELIAPREHGGKVRAGTIFLLILFVLLVAVVSAIPIFQIRAPISCHKAIQVGHHLDRRISTARQPLRRSKLANSASLIEQIEEADRRLDAIGAAVGVITHVIEDRTAQDVRKATTGGFVTDWKKAYESIELLCGLTHDCTQIYRYSLGLLDTLMDDLTSVSSTAKSSTQKVAQRVRTDRMSPQQYQERLDQVKTQQSDLKILEELMENTSKHRDVQTADFQRFVRLVEDLDNLSKAFQTYITSPGLGSLHCFR